VIGLVIPPVMSRVPVRSLPVLLLVVFVLMTSLNLNCSPPCHPERRAWRPQGHGGDKPRHYYTRPKCPFVYSSGDPCGRHVPLPPPCPLAPAMSSARRARPFAALRVTDIADCPLDSRAQSLRDLQMSTKYAASVLVKHALLLLAHTHSEFAQPLPVLRIAVPLLVPSPGSVVETLDRSMPCT